MADLSKMPEYLTEEEAAKAVRKSPNTLAQDRYLGRGLPFVRAGRRILYRREDIQAYLDAGREVPA